jgi:NitT/TauT family transport system permease protein
MFSREFFNCLEGFNCVLNSSFSWHHEILQKEWLIIKKSTYIKQEATLRTIPNVWDVLALLIVFFAIFALGIGAKSMIGQYHLGQRLSINLSMGSLPYYALRTFLRMIIALFFSLVFTFVVGTWAAKSPRAEIIIIPLIDILQSIPPLGYLSIIFVSFVVFFRGSLLGPECAAIFTIFTAQVWNMTLSFYQSLKTVPADLREASDIFQLNSWQRFWKLEVPFAMPDLVWNMMMSMSGSWVYLIQSEAIEIAGKTVTLPGIGSYIGLANYREDLQALLYVVITMLVVILLYDQLIFRPLVSWSEKFKPHTDTDVDYPESWVINLFQRAQFLRSVVVALKRLGSICSNIRLFSLNGSKQRDITQQKNFSGMKILVRWLLVFVWWASVIGLMVYTGGHIVEYIFSNLALSEVMKVVYLGFLSLLRIMVVLLISVVIWVPVGVWIGSRPKLTHLVQPIAQFLAAFPINLLFPFAAMLMMRYQLDVNIWCAPLMILGTQWYILFNVISGASSLPKKLRHAASVFHVNGFLKWRKLILPGIFPYLITGVIAAAGGAWNITFIAEYINFGHTQLVAAGIGAYLARYAADPHGSAHVVLALTVMVVYVVLINRLVWRPLYKLSQQRFQLE